MQAFSNSRAARMRVTRHDAADFAQQPREFDRDLPV
jgi:hypothetical protein